MWGRTWNWWRRRTALIDFLFMSPLLLLTALTLPAVWMPTQYAHENRLLYVLIALLLCVPLVWRRKYPRVVFAVVASTAFVQWLVGVLVAPLALQLMPADVAVLVALYTVAAECTFRWAVAAGVVAEAGAIMEVLREQRGTWSMVRNALITTSIVVGGIWVLGVYINTRRAYLRSLEERAARLERERDAEVQIAMAAERARIARELHDVVAHNVSVIVVQADGALFAIETDVQRAKRALEAISGTGRAALAEMRRLLGVLRQGDGDGTYAPQPGIDQLTELVQQVGESGLPVEFAVRGVPLELPPGLQLTVFRVVQEALTNVLKHAGPEASARLSLHYGDGAVEIEVSDDGRGAAVAGDGRGHGLIGMRERVAVFNGAVRAGPRQGGGYEVRVRLPVRDAVAVTAMGEAAETAATAGTAGTAGTAETAVATVEAAGRGM